MASSPYIVDARGVRVLRRESADPPDDAPDGALVVEFNDGQPIAQAYLTVQDALTVASALLSVVKLVDRLAIAENREVR